MLTGVWQVGKTVPLVIDGAFEDVSDDGRYCHCLKISFCETSDNFTYNGIDYEEFSKDKLCKYVYMRGGANGGDKTPTSKFVDALKTTKRINTSINDLLKISVDTLESKMFRQISSFLESNLDLLVKDIEEYIKNLTVKKGEGFFLTITIKNNTDERYMGDFDIVNKKLLSASASKYYDKYNKVSKGNGTCYFCKKVSEVYGFVNTYNSYTVDKVGFVSNGFRQENAFKNYPVCNSCANELDNGKQFIEKNMSSKFCGFNYSIIPKFTFDKKSDIEEVMDIFKDYENRKFSLNDETRKCLLSSEKDFLEFMSESDNNLNYNMLIYREEQAGAVFKILAFIEDIVPSKLKRILRVKSEVEKEIYFKGQKGKDDNTYDMTYSFNLLRQFFPNGKIEGNFDKNFLEIINNIFSNRNISYDFLLNRIMTCVSIKFSNEQYFDKLLLEGFMNIRFIESLALFNNKRRGVSRAMTQLNEKNKIYLDYLELHKETLDSDAKKSIFLTGVLVGKLLSIQYSERKSTPFYARLNGLKLSESLVKRIFTEAINKLNEYNKNYYVELESLIAEYMLTKDIISNDETSFFFALGMTLSKKIKIEEEDKNND